MNSEARKRAQELAAAGDDRQRGLYGKFRVERISDPDGKHAGCRYFVLDPQHDDIARVALVTYSDAARELGYVALADDLDALIEDSAADREDGAAC